MEVRHVFEGELQSPEQVSRDEFLDWVSGAMDELKASNEEFRLML